MVINLCGQPPSVFYEISICIEYLPTSCLLLGVHVIYPWSHYIIVCADSLSDIHIGFTKLAAVLIRLGLLSTVLLPLIMAYLSSCLSFLLKILFSDDIFSMDRSTLFKLYISLITLERLHMMGGMLAPAKLFQG